MTTVTDKGPNLSRQALWVAIGSMFSFGFGIVSTMILSRYFNQEDYGTYKQVMYVYQTMLGVFTLGLPRAYSFFIPRVKMSECRNLIKKITNLLLLAGICFSLILFIGADFIADLLKNPKLATALKVFAITPTIILPTMGLEGIMAALNKNHINVLYVVITRALMLICVALPPVLWHTGYVESIVGFVISSFISLIVFFFIWGIPLKGERKDKTEVSYKSIMNFALPLLWASLFGIINMAADQFFISRYFGTKEFAIFSNGWMDLPFIGMITGACATVLSPLFSRLSAEMTKESVSQLIDVWNSVFKKSILLIYPVLLYCISFPDYIMEFLYGDIYVTSAPFFIIKNISFFFTVIVFGPLLINIGKVNLYKNILLWTTIGQISTQYLSVILYADPIIIALLSLFWQISRALLMLYFITKIFQHPFRMLVPFKIIIKSILICIIILLIVRKATLSITSDIVLILTTSATSFGILYLLVSKTFGINYLEIIKSLKRT